MYAKFPLFRSHLDLAHHYWKQIIVPGDTVIDATCGNGHDTLVLAKLALTNTTGSLIGYDIQQSAIENTRKLLSENLPKEQIQHLQLILGCHSQFSKDIKPQSVKLIVYNLGYLPGGDKSKTTQASQTWVSLKAAMDLIMPGGAISVTCYPGHPEGKLEEELILDKISSLEAKLWSCCQHRWINRRESPSLLLLQKSG